MNLSTNGVNHVVKLKSNYHSKQKVNSPKQQTLSNIPYLCSSAQQQDSINFRGLKKIPSNKLRAILLSFMTLLPNHLAKADDVVVKTADEAALKTAQIIEDTSKKGHEIDSKLIISDKTELPPIKIYNESEFAPILKELANDFPNNVKPGQSFYYDPKTKPSDNEVITRKLNDYKSLLENIPASFAKGGTDSINLYKSSVISILKTCGEYGAMYIKNIPDPQNIMVHAQELIRLSTASEKIQGCKFQNAALFNGFSAEELMKKVVIPNEKIANNEIVGKNQNILIAITPEFGRDRVYTTTFDSKTYFTKHAQVLNKIYDFNDSLFGHYDNILVIQPNGKNADDVLDTAFPNIEKNLFKGTKADIMYIGEITPVNGAILSNRYRTAIKDDGIYMLDIGDFNPSDKGGKPFSISIANIFINAIDAGYKPRIIGDGCKSEQLLQNSINKILPENYRDKVKVFGTPYFVNDNSITGFSTDNKLSFVNKVDPFFDTNKGLLIRITEPEKKIQSDWQKTDSFILDDVLQKKIIADYYNGIKNGVLVKPNGMIMEYSVISYRNP